MKLWLGVVKVCKKLPTFRNLSILLIFSLFVTPILASEDTPSTRNRQEIGIGVGPPFGGIGIDYGYFISDFLEISAGLGYTRGGLGWAFGGVYYPLKSNTYEFNPRLSLYHGVIGTIEYSSPSGNRYSTLMGNTFGVGFREKLGFDIDVMYTTVDLPAGAVITSGNNIFIMVGFTFPIVNQRSNFTLEEH